jgi:hypothetical protein
MRWTRFIWRTPASIHKFQLAILHQLLDFLSLVLILFVPPHLKELNFSKCPGSIVILNQLVNGGPDDIFYLINVSVAEFSAIIIFVNCVNPA